MIFKRRTIDNLKTEEATVITTGVYLDGAIKGTADVILHGVLEGNIQLSGMLVLGKSGKIRGKIDARNVVIEGDFEGIIKATEKVEIRDGGKFKGDIFTATIAVSENAYFEGNVKMEVEDRESSVIHFTEKRRCQSEKEGELAR
jgi:cytoskeletal protein CcmA (bactofilin family)